MHGMLRAILGGSCFLVIAWQSTNAATVVIPAETDWAAHVFVGPDSGMPLDPKSYYIALNATKDSRGAIVIPPTVSDALLELRHALPHWYMNALARSSAAYACSVMVASDHNVEIDFATLVEDWYWVHWNLQDRDSALRKDLAKRGLSDQFFITQGLRAGFCSLVKDGDLGHAVLIVSKYGHR